MKHNPAIHRRRSIRLKDFDYSQPGGYYITICTHNHVCLLGEIQDGEMIPNDLGKIVLRTWQDLPAPYPNVELDTFCLMPNHIHGIIILTDPVGVDLRSTPTSRSTPTPRHGLPEIVRALKSFSARLINLSLNSPGEPVWQRNYYEHVIRNEGELNAIRQYILDNPLQWELDRDNPANIKTNKS